MIEKCPKHQMRLITALNGQYTYICDACKRKIIKEVVVVYDSTNDKEPAPPEQ